MWSLQCDSDDGCVGDVLVLEECCFQLGGGYLESIDFDEFLRELAKIIRID